jgi:hypothetical protein
VTSPSLPCEVDQHDVRVLSRPVEHNLLAVRCDVECPDIAPVVEMSQLTGGLGGDVEEPEIERDIDRQENQVPAVWQKTIPTLSHSDGGQINRRTIRSHGE